MIDFVLATYSKIINSLKHSDGIKARVGRGSIWAIIDFGGDTFLRMLSSLILTRIFLPDIFGLLAIIYAIMIGINLILVLKSVLFKTPMGISIIFFEQLGLFRLFVALYCGLFSTC